MIIDKAECKKLVNYTDSENDTLIENYIPIVQEDLCEYLNNWFRDDLITYVLGECAFVKGSPDTITDNQSDFVNRRFAAGMDIKVDAGENENSRIFELATVTAGTLTLTSNNELVSMSYADTYYNLGPVQISKINWPKALKLVAARMVKYLVDRSNHIDGAMAKTVDGVVMSYDRGTSYPREILDMAQRYRRPRFA